MKFLGIDYGSKRIGTAVSNAEGTIAFPRSTLLNDGSLLSNLKDLVSKEKIERIIVGDTRTHGGAANPVTKEAEQFMLTLAQGTAVETIPVFEVFSSIEASRYAPGSKQHDDSAAAAVILQRYLDMHTSRG